MMAGAEALLEFFTAGTPLEASLAFAAVRAASSEGLMPWRAAISYDRRTCCFKGQ